MMFAKINSKLSGLSFATRNLSAARRLVKITNEEVDGLLFRGYSSSDVEAITKIYQQLNEGAAFSWMLRGLYSHIGRRCLLVVEQRDAVGTSRIVGMNMYYLNQRDIKENTIHEGFIGVLPEVGGRGIATRMRQTAINNFKLAGFYGISTRISLNNAASLMSAKKIGFQPVEEYQDPLTGEKRYYMICKF